MPRTRKRPRPEPAACSYPSGRGFGTCRTRPRVVRAGCRVLRRPPRSSRRGRRSGGRGQACPSAKLRRVVDKLANRLTIQRMSSATWPSASRPREVDTDIRGGDPSRTVLPKSYPDVVAHGGRVDLERGGRLCHGCEESADSCSIRSRSSVARRRSAGHSGEGRPGESADRADRTAHLVGRSSLRSRPTAHHLLSAVGGAAGSGSLGALRRKECYEASAAVARNSSPPARSTDGTRWAAPGSRPAPLRRSPKR